MKIVYCDPINFLKIEVMTLKQVPPMFFLFKVNTIAPKWYRNSLNWNTCILAFEDVFTFLCMFGGCLMKVEVNTDLYDVT